MHQLLTLQPDLKKWGHITEREDVIEYRLDTIEQLKYLVEYLRKYGLHSRKAIAYAK